MHIRATFGADGQPTGFFTDAIYGHPLLDDGTANPAYPADSVEISEAQYGDLLGNPGLRKWDAKTSTVITYTPPPPPPMVRTASVADLLDSLAATQRSTISADNMQRLIARGAEGAVTEANAKVIRAAKDMSLPPKAWFDAALGVGA